MSRELVVFLLTAHSSMLAANFPFSTFLGRSGYRRRAFRYIFARSAIASLAKDAAPIPNALETTNTKSRVKQKNS